MKKWIILWALCLQTLSFAAELKNLQIELPELRGLATGLGLEVEADLVEEIGRLGLRPAHKERWEMEELSVERRAVVLDWAREQGMFAECAPVCNHYDKALIFGATRATMQTRLNYLIELWERGVRFEEVVWLTGNCNHNKSDESIHNEDQAAHTLWENALMAEEMRRLPVTFVTVPMKVENEISKRANTEDTIRAWVELAKEPCSALFISNQPFCGYQFAVVKTAMPREFFYDCAGPGADPSSHPAAGAIVLDTIARWAFLEKLLMTND